MSEFFRVVVVVTAAAHFAFVGYGVIGGFLALRWPRTIWLHILAVMWCVAIDIVDFRCPLTWLEEWSRAGAELSPLGSSGFIDHYITGVWYPAKDENLVQGLVLVAVITSWILVARSTRRRRSSVRSTERREVVRRSRRSHVPGR